LIMVISMKYLSESTALLYSELLQQCASSSLPLDRGISFVSKKINEKKHWYLQLVVGSAKSQHYIGPDTKEIQQKIASEKALIANKKPEADQRKKLVAMLVSGGAYTISASEARVFEVLVRAGVFLANGTIVGSQAFATYGNILGVQWDLVSSRTSDVDIANDYNLKLGINAEKADVKQALINAQMGFFEVPALNPKSPSTQFKIRGQQLMVDILTPMRGETSSKPIKLKSLNTYATPIRFIDYLLEDTIPAVIVAKSGFLVSVPNPARYALHKLVVSQRRLVSEQNKANKDIQQANQIIEVLLEDRPGDLIVAYEATKKMPEKFILQMKKGIKKLDDNLSKKLVAELKI